MLESPLCLYWLISQTLLYTERECLVTFDLTSNRLKNLKFMLQNSFLFYGLSPSDYAGCARVPQNFHSFYIWLLTVDFWGVVKNDFRQSRARDVLKPDEFRINGRGFRMEYGEIGILTIRERTPSE